MPRKTKPAFRFCRMSMGLTYSCPVDKEDHPIATHEEILEFIDKFGINMYLIGKELHANGKVHWHVYVKWVNLVESTNPHFMDLKGVHPNILKGKPGKGWINYCAKDKEYLTNFYEADPFTEALSMADADEAINNLWHSQPRFMLCQAHNIEPNLRKRLTPIYKYPVLYGPYPQYYYPYGWNPKEQALLLWGEPGVGKTTFARHLLNNDCIYIKGTLEGLKKIQFTKHLLLDEIYLVDADAQISREITDVPNGGTVKARYGDIYIPPGICRIFCSNYERPFRNPQGAVYGHRVFSHQVLGPNLRFA